MERSQKLEVIEGALLVEKLASGFEQMRIGNGLCGTTDMNQSSAKKKTRVPCSTLTWTNSSTTPSNPRPGIKLSFPDTENLAAARTYTIISCKLSNNRSNMLVWLDLTSSGSFLDSSGESLWYAIERYSTRRAREVRCAEASAKCQLSSFYPTCTNKTLVKKSLAIDWMRTCELSTNCPLFHSRQDEHIVGCWPEFRHIQL